jgi:hypothetical protein
MIKLALTILFTTYSLLGFAQKTLSDFTKTKDFKTGICTITHKSLPLAPGLHYTLIKEIDVKNDNKTTYSLKVTMDEPFKKTLNNQLAYSVELGDGTYFESNPTKENAGWFKGTFTLVLTKPERSATLGVKHVLLHGEKTILYHILESNNVTYKNNLTQLMQEQI